MAIQVYKGLQQIKSQAVSEVYVTGSAQAPAAGHLQIYLDTVDLHRQVEIMNILTELASRAREENYRRTAGVDVTCYWYCNINDGKAGINFTTTVAAISDGEIGIGMSAEVRNGGWGSTIIDTCFQELDDVAREKNLKRI